MKYTTLTKDELLSQKKALEEEYKALCEKHLSLDMSRGKPEKRQLELSEQMLTTISRNEDCYADNGTDCRNYGLVDGIEDAKKLFADILEVRPENVIVGGNSSLNLMYDAMVRCLLYGVNGGNGPWVKNKVNKFLCPVPGYDRHFGICESLGIEMINIPMTENGPDPDEVEKWVKDPDVRGIWCVPKYSNPEGYTYSDETVKRFAALTPASKDFRIFWDNAYCIHDLYDEGDSLLNIIDECEKAGHPNLPYVFMSTSKITYPGSGVSVMASSVGNIEHIKKVMAYQTIGHDKMNMLRHVKYFKDADGMRAYMKKHAEILRPKFETVLSVLNENLGESDIAAWTNPRGGYFISFNTLPDCAKRTAELCAKAGVKLTEAGATFPYRKDPEDKNIRIAPSFPTCEELREAIGVLCVCTKLAAVEKLLQK